jgi:hypothetical protein
VDPGLDTQEHARRINPFDWDDETFGFGKVMRENGGFDAVVGNPPYTRVQLLREFKPEEAKLYEEHYEAAKEGSYDIAMPFVEKALSLLRPPRAREPAGGRLGYIVSRQFCEADSGRPLRRILSSGSHVCTITDFGAGMVFDGVGAYTLLLGLSQGPAEHWHLCRVPPPPSGPALASALRSPGLNAELRARVLSDAPWTLSLPQEQALLDRLGRQFPTLSDVSGGQIYQGVVTGADSMFRVIECGEAEGALLRVRPRSSAANSAPILVERALLRPVHAGRSAVRRFLTEPSREWVILPYEQGKGGHYALIPPGRMAEVFPHTFAWLEACRSDLERRAGKWDRFNWYSYSRRQNLERFDSDSKIMVPYMVEELCATYDESHHFFVNVSTGGYGIDLAAGAPLTARFLTALLNSEVLSWALRRYSRAWRGEWFAARKQNLAPLPVAIPTPEQERGVLDAYSDCCEAASKCHLSRKGSADREVREHLLAMRVEEFDRQVMSLYGLSEDECAVVRSARKVDVGS